MKREEKKQENVAMKITPQDLQLDESRVVSVAPEALAMCIRVQRQNARQGTVSAKTRGEVTSRSNKKPWKQKGTGRARAGSPRSPLWRGGGVVFPPQPREKELKISRELNRKVLGSLLWERMQENRIIALDDQNLTNAKTIQAYALLEQAQLQNKKLALFVNVHDEMSHRAFANIPAVRMYLYDQPNVYMLANADYWVLLKKDIEHFKNMVNVWI